MDSLQIDKEIFPQIPSSLSKRFQMFLTVKNGYLYQAKNQYVTGFILKISQKYFLSTHRQS